jgi:ferredoxin
LLVRRGAKCELLLTTVASKSKKLGLRRLCKGEVCQLCQVQVKNSDQRQMSELLERLLALANSVLER